MDTIKKIYYKISEVAKLINEPASCLRFWETQFHLTVKRNKNGVRVFTQEDIIKFREIKFLIREENLTYKGVKKRLDI